MNVLALDPATSTGWAHHPSGRHGVWRLDEKRRRSDLEDRIFEAHNTFGPLTKIAYEDASFGSFNPSTQAFHNELAGVINLAAERLGIFTVSYKPTSIKLFLTGSGKATKQQMIRACEIRLGINVLYHDEADALAVLEMAKQGLVIGSPKKPAKRFTKRQREKMFLF